jgi:uncharacterized protein
MSIQAAAAAAEPKHDRGVPALWRGYLLTEFALLFVGLPTLYVFDGIPFPMIPALLLVTIGCTVLLLRDRHFDRKQLWNRAPVVAALKRIVPVFVVSAVVIGIGVAFLEPERLFEILKRNPVLWVTIMIFYPLFSVYPQELVYRTFMFHRYRAIFPNRWLMIAMSAFAFGYMHIVFENALAVIMTLLGGTLFAWTYAHSRSTLLVCIEHSLYGCFIFTIGLGWYFYGGAVR